MTSIFDQPIVSFGREICGDLAAAARREWIVTNGLGGYASGTLAGINTRRYHGLLVAALAPPVERTLLVGGLIEWASYDGQRIPLFAHEYIDGTIDGHGYRYLESFRLDGTMPVWTFALADALIERRVWMQHGTNTTYVRYALVRGTRPLDLSLAPLITYRDFHSLSRGGWTPETAIGSECVRVQASREAQPFHLIMSGSDFKERGEWYWNFRHREEAARGLDDQSDLFVPGAFGTTIQPGEACALILSTDADPDRDYDRSLRDERDRQQSLLTCADAENDDPIIQQLVLAADQFIVRRTENKEQSAERGESRTSNGLLNPKSIIAGYHWFNDWGRDTMIALPGLCVATHRFDDAATILRTFAPYVVDGLLPNNFPDHAGVVPGYNTVDATLWYVIAIHAYERATADRSLVDDLLPVIREIVDRHIGGTRYGIGVDPADGLLRAGETGVQLTWMDAKIGDWVVTPRIGKPVEINALWFNVLQLLAAWLKDRREPAADSYSALAERAQAAFRSRFTSSQRGYLPDVIDGPDGDDWTLRPNQIFAVSLPFPLLDGEVARAAVDVVGRALLTSYGLRSLASSDPAYRGDYGGDSVRRDSGYHQGPVWAWLLGAYAEAHHRVHGDAEAAIRLLTPLVDHLRDAGLGSISEIFEGDAPHGPRGCVAQAWSVAETLRVWRALNATIRSNRT